MLDGSIAGGAANVLDLRDVEPPPHAARVFQREPRDAARRRGSASRRIGRGEDLAVRALRACGSRSIRSARTTTSRRSPAGSRTSACKPPASARDAQARTQEALQWALRAARAAAAWPGNSRRTTPATTLHGRRSVERRDVVRVAAAVLLRARRRGAAGAASARASPTPATGSFRAASSSPARSPRDALTRELREELGIDVRRAVAVARPGIRLPACARRAPFLPRVRVGRRTRRARRAGVRMAGAGQLHGRAAAAGQHADPRRARAAAGLRHHAARATSAKTRSSRAPSARSSGGLRLIQLREKDWPRRASRRVRASARSARASLRRAGSC